MGSPKSPCFLGKGRTATRGQGIPTGYAYRVRRVRTQASRASGCPPRRPSPLWLALPQVCGKASLFGRWLLSPTRRGVLGAPIGCSDTITGQKPGPTTPTTVIAKPARGLWQSHKQGMNFSVTAYSFYDRGIPTVAQHACWRSLGMT